MRVVLEVGARTVELENNIATYTHQRDEIFFELVVSSLRALGYTDEMIRGYVIGQMEVVEPDDCGCNK